MHKFTIFTILFSVIVVFVVADLVLNDYWGDDFASEERLREEEESLSDVLDSDETASVDLSDSESRGDESDSPLEEVPESSDDEADERVIADISDVEELLFEAPEDEPDLSESSDSLEEEPLNIDSPLPAQIDSIGLLAPLANTDAYTGLIYGFWDVEDTFDEFLILRHKVFDDNQYVGTVYEVQTGNEVERFGAYETLKELGENSPSGSINENDAYGEASFYFNHTTKTNTVFLTVQVNGGLYAFEYLPSYHPNMTALVNLL